MRASRTTAGATTAKPRVWLQMLTGLRSKKQPLYIVNFSFRSQQAQGTRSAAEASGLLFAVG